MAQTVLFYLSLVLFAFTGWLGARALSRPVASRLRAARALLAISAAALLALLAVEGLGRGGPLFGGLFHLLIGVAFLVAVGGLAADAWLRMPLLNLGSAAAGAALLVGALSLDPSVAASRDLLANRWIGLHIACMLAAYAAFTVGSLSAALFLIAEAFLKRKHRLEWVDRIPALETLDALEAAAVGAGFVFLTVGLVVGYQVQRVASAYATDWRLDPKVVWTGATWLAYLAVLVARRIPWLRGRKAAMLALLGFFFVAFTALGVRTGFHAFEPPGASVPAVPSGGSR